MSHQSTVGESGNITHPPGDYKKYLTPNVPKRTHPTTKTTSNKKQKQTSIFKFITSPTSTQTTTSIPTSSLATATTTTTTTTPNSNTKTSNTSQPNQTDSSNEAWGDELGPKPDNCYRICFENINGLGFDIHHNIKQDRFITWAREHDIDAIGWAEVNINWRLATPSEKLRERLRPGKWDRMSVSTAHNIHEKLTKYQPGGVSLVTFDQLSHRMSASGADPSGLGRWTWQSFRCKTKTVRIVTAYQPNITIGDDKQTVYAQHKRYLKYIKKINLCPRETFRIDLAAELEPWIANDDAVILLLDANDDLRDSPTHTWLTTMIGLRNGIHCHHPNTEPPSTYSRNFKNKPIDGCYTTPNLPILKGGFRPFREGIGDHRILYIDVDVNTWFEGEMYKVAHLQVRKLKFSDVRTVKKYQQELRRLLDNKGMLERTQWLYSTFNIPLTESQQVEYEKIDQFVTECCLTAEKKCRKMRAGQVPFSPLVDTAAKTIYLWNLVLNKMRGTKVSSSLIHRLSKKCEIIIDPSLSFEDVRLLRNKAIKRYKVLKPKATQSRERFISDLADAIEEVYGTNKATAVRSLTVNEEQRTIHRQIKSKLHKTGGSVSKLEIPNPYVPGEYIWTEDKQVIEESIITANQKKFKLADNTPFRQEPLLSQCGRYADTDSSRDILLGNYDRSQVDMGTGIFIRHLQVTDEILSRPPIPNKIETSEFQDYWRKVREKTSASPSGRHFGHWKSIARSNDLSQMFTKLVSIPVETGYAPIRWRNRLECSLQKKGKGLKPEELRTIVLLEADYNQCVKLIFGKRMMRNSEYSSDYPTSQYGSKRGAKAIEAVRLKRMSLDVIRLNRQPAAMITTDLHSCYDRIVHTVGALSSRKNGVQPEPIRMMIDTIQNCTNSVRTAYGDSERSYGCTPDDPFHGTGQGSGASPAVWFAITIVLIEALLHERIGTFIVTAISAQLIRFPAILFVDDTDFIITGNANTETANSILLHSQHALYIWGALLHATGGSLRPEKCRWSLIEFGWKKGEPFYKKTNESPGILTAHNSDRQLEIVRRLEPQTCVEILGVYMNTTGTDEKEFKRTIGNVEEWNVNMMEGTIFKQAAHRALRSTIYRTVTYRLPATQFTPSQCTNINFNLHRNILSKMGINNRIANVYRYAPTAINGIGLMDVRLEQCISHIMEFLSHAGRATLNDNIMLAELELGHLHSGLSGNLFRLDYDTYHYLLPECELKFLLRECHHYNIQLQGEYTRPGTQRTDDRFLMDMLLEADFSQTNISKVNHCRLYLQCLTLSDITNGAGGHINPHAYDGKDPGNRNSRFKWPHQPKPAKSWWTQWKLAIDTVWSNFMALPTALGTWTDQPHKKWVWYQDGATDSLYKQENSTIQRHEALHHLQRRTRAYYSPFGEMVDRLPLSACPVIPSWSNNAYSCTSGYPLYRPPAPTQFRTFFHALDKCDPILQRWLQYSFFQDPTLSNAITLIERGEAILVADGSYLPNNGIATAAWVLAGPTGPIEATGYSRLPDGNNMNDAYRAELFGLSLALSMLTVLKEFKPDLTGTVTISCDNDEALRHGIEYKLWPRASSPHFDMIATVHRYRRQLQLQLCPKRVRGHQDNIKGTKLTRLEELNVIADNAAKTLAYKIERNRVIQEDLPSLPSQWQVCMDHKVFKKNVRSELEYRISSKRLIEHWINKGKLTENVIPIIDWDALRTAISRKPLHHQRWAAKFVSGFCGSYYKLHQMGKHPTPLCPRCNLFEETTSHILFCQHAESKQHRIKSLETLTKWLDNTQTRWDIRETIVDTLTDLHPTSSLSAHVPFNPYDDDIFDAARLQDMIGVANFLEGFINVQWRHIMEKHYRDTKSNRTSTSWAAGLHFQLQQFSRAQWEHRNSVVHARNAHGRKLTSEKDITKRLEYQLRMGIRFLPAHLHHLAHFDLTTALKEPRSKILSWLHHLEVVRPFYEEVESQEVNTQRIFFRHWLRL